jgi:predicted nucleic acid-binding Zn ribbon protein
MTEENDLLRNTVKWRKKKPGQSAVRLADTLSELMQTRISPRQARLGRVVQCWEQLLPDELACHCRISGITGGQLNVNVDMACYLYELRLCSSSLLKQLQRQCPRARIKKIKFTVG